MKQFFSILTLGCKINQYESQALREAWQRCGLQPTEDATQADIVLVNSCAVTAGALRDVRTAVRRVLRENPKARIIVTGCAAESDREGLGDLAEIVEFIPQSAKTRLMAGPPASSRHPIYPGSRQHGGDFYIRSYERGRAVLKIQDGCSHRCTYCIIPRSRGKSRSRPLTDVLAESDRLLAAGFGEITISGINLAQYGCDKTPPEIGDMWDLLRLLNDRFALRYQDRARFRLSSLYPAQISGRMKQKALDTLAACPMICPHLHLSLQSLSPNVLRRMGRKTYDMDGVASFLKALEAIWPIYGLGADFICGFPGETEDDFRMTFKNAVALPLSYAHVFPYSVRPGTVAAQMAQTVDQSTKKTRAKELRALVTVRKTDFIHRLKKMDSVVVALERTSADRTATAGGMTQYYVEGVFETPPENCLPGSLVQARPVGSDGQKLIVAQV